MHSLRTPVLLLALVLAPLCARAQREKLPPEDYDIVMQRWPNAQISSTGVRYVVEKSGSGPLIASGNLVDVLYTGKLLNGKVFDQTLDRKSPFRFRVNRGEVIQGWDQVFQLMRPGDKWLLIIPPELAYGRRGSPPAIPSYATLVFEVEILGIKKED